MKPMTRRARAGFSAFEMGLCFVAIAIGSFGVFLVGRIALSRARDSSCASNLHQLALATQMYCADNAGRGPLRDPASRLQPYTKNLQILYCPSNPLAAARTLGHDAQEVNVGYEFRLGLWSDDPPGTLVVQDLAPDKHTRRTWQAARLDGAVMRAPADQWKSLR